MSEHQFLFIHASFSVPNTHVFASMILSDYCFSHIYSVKNHFSRWAQEDCHFGLQHAESASRRQADLGHSCIKSKGKVSRKAGPWRSVVIHESWTVPAVTRGRLAPFPTLARWCPVLAAGIFSAELPWLEIQQHFGLYLKMFEDFS